MKKKLVAVALAAVLGLSAGAVPEAHAFEPTMGPPEDMPVCPVGTPPGQAEFEGCIIMHYFDERVAEEPGNPE